MSQNMSSDQQHAGSKWDKAAEDGSTITIPQTASNLADQLKNAGFAEQVSFSGNQPTDTSQGIRVRLTQQAKGQMSQYATQLEQAGAQISDDKDSSTGESRS